MSDPQPAPERRTPPRAEPIQPDKPVSGDDRIDENDPAAVAEQVGHDTAKRQKDQSDAALDNVREGYG